MTIEKKKEFLLTKLPTDIVNKSIDIYYSIEPKILDEYHSIEEAYSKSFFSTFFNPYIMSCVLLISIGTNYLFDINRNKKNEILYKEKEAQLKNETKESLLNVKSKFDSNVSKINNLIYKD